MVSRLYVNLLIWTIKKIDYLKFIIYQGAYSKQMKKEMTYQEMQLLKEKSKKNFERKSKKVQPKSKKRKSKMNWYEDEEYDDEKK